MQFSRSSGSRFYKRLFLVGVEGTRTERDYFSMFSSRYVHVIPVPSRGGNNPVKVLATLKAEIPHCQLREGDYLWLVVDRDEWPESEIEACRRWAVDPGESPSQIKGFSLSNPKFEFWLLLHFEDGMRHTTAKACYEALCEYLTDYSKSLNRGDFNRTKIDLACARAKALLGTADPAAWPRSPGQTTVFTLCEAIRRVDEEEQRKLMSEFMEDETGLTVKSREEKL